MKILVTILLSALFIAGSAQKPKTEEESKYLEVLRTRSEKIIEEYLPIDDEKKFVVVRDMIVKQYWDLNKVHDERDARLKVLKEKLEKDKYETQKEKLQAKSEKALAKIHSNYLINLAKHLNSEQIEGVKNGMTFNVLNHTYNAYTNMLPDLTEEQKTKIMDWLTEAREIAMDKGTSGDKHKVFGQYKGRINNYLSAEGYDLKKAGDALQGR